MVHTLFILTMTSIKEVAMFPVHYIKEIVNNFVPVCITHGVMDVYAIQ